MADFDYARLTYLVTLLAVLLGSVLMTRRGALGKLAKQTGAWLFIFVATIAAVGMWQDIRGMGKSLQAPQSAATSSGKIVIPKHSDGHYYLHLRVNDQSLKFMLDTGASQIVLSGEDAARLGFKRDDLNFWMRVATANGEVKMAPVRLQSIKLADFQDNQVSAVVSGGALQQSLLGMSYLNRFKSVEISQNRMILTR